MKHRTILIFLIPMLLLSSGCATLDIEDMLNRIMKDVGVDGNATVPLTDGIQHPGEIMLGAWNIQDYGPKKSENSAVMATIVDVIDDFSMVAVQEVSNEECGDGMCGQLSELMARLPSKYTYKISTRVGRSSQKEQYLLIYDKTMFTLLGYEMFEDTYDIFEREPMIAEFKMGNDVDFMVVVCHVRPDSAPQEISALEKVIEFVGTKYSDRDIVVMGDLNADGSYYNGAILPGMIALIPDYVDTTVGDSDNAYDRIFVTPSMSQYVKGTDKGYVYRRADITKSVSDHYPVYFIFEGA